MIGASSFAVDIGDPDSTRTVWAIVALLVVMGLGLVMLAFWLRRTTRPDPELLAPLELMGERSWRRGDPVWQRRRLDEVRPSGAVPLRRPAAPPNLDESFDEGPSGAGFDDLHDDQHTGGPEESARVRHTPSETPAVARDVDATASEPDATADVATEPESAGAAEDDATQTPIGASRPFLDDLPEHDIDPDDLRRAMAELDAELQRNPDD